MLPNLNDSRMFSRSFELPCLAALNPKLLPGTGYGFGDEALGMEEGIEVGFRV